VNVVRVIDMASLGCMGVAIALMLQPWWAGGLPFGFWFLIASTIAQIVFSHLPQTPYSPGDDDAAAVPHTSRLEPQASEKP